MSRVRIKKIGGMWFYACFVDGKLSYYGREKTWDAAITECFATKP